MSRPDVSRCITHVLPWLALAAGCHDYRLHEWKDASGTDSGSAFDPELDSADYQPLGDTAGVVPVLDIASNASINLRFEYNNFGNDAQGCSFEVAFYTVAEDDGYGDGGTAQTISMPEAAGTCAYTLFDPDDTGTGGSMSVQGTLDAGPELHASNDLYDITLLREAGDDGALRYQWDACTRETFPFAQVLTLSGTGADGAIPAFDLPDAIAVGPDVAQHVPAADDLELGILPQSLSEPLDWQWSWSASFPSTSEGEVTVSQMFVLRNQRSADDQLLESLACMPAEDGVLTVPAEELAQLTPDPGDDSTYATAQLDTYFYGDEADAPWGQTLRSQSVISLSGLLRLSP